MKAKPLYTETDILLRNDEEVMFSEVDGESVIMHLQTGRYFGLNSVSTDIWNHLEKKITFPQLVELLVSEYEVEKELCEKETGDIVQVLLRMKFLKKQL